MRSFRNDLPPVFVPVFKLELKSKEEYRGKLRYLDEIGHKFWQDDSEVVMAVLENEPGELN
jgi:hypothetical protein